jgi:serine/threonine-protein kinase
MATVYLARDLRHDRRIAIKVLHPALAASLGPGRFLREIKVVAGLQHPNILPVHDSGEAAGRLWFAMPYVEGESLRARLVRMGELPVDEAVRLLRDVVDALACAHQHGVVHRDIKPDNVLLSGHHAIVADFGVAKALSAAVDDSALTTEGMAIGTPAYMAPEHLRRSDRACPRRWGRWCCAVWRSAPRTAGRARTTSCSVWSPSRWRRFPRPLMRLRRRLVPA